MPPMIQVHTGLLTWCGMREWAQQFARNNRDGCCLSTWITRYRCMSGGNCQMAYRYRMQYLLEVLAWYHRVPGCSAGSVTPTSCMPAGCILARLVLSGCGCDQTVRSTRDGRRPRPHSTTCETSRSNFSFFSLGVSSPTGQPTGSTTS
jgi:hypothetical protein